MLGEFFEEIWDEASDFYQDLWELFTKRTHSRPVKRKKTVIDGVTMTVRPAYLFARRVDNTLKLVFGVSICVSGLTATIFGFTKLSDLLDALIGTYPGRGLMLVIGGSYVLTAIWSLLQITDKS